MNTWEGIPTRGRPGGKPVSGNIPHIQNSAWYDPSDGNPDGLGPLKILCTTPPAPEPPEELRAEGYFRQKDLGLIDSPKDYVKVVFPPSPFSPGWTQNPSDPNAKYVVALDGDGEPIFGEGPGSATEARALALIRTGAAMLIALGK